MNQTSQQYFKALQIVFYAFLAGEIIFAAVAIGLVQTQNMTTDPGMADVFVYIVPVMAFAALIIGNLLYKNFLNGAKSKETLPQKMAVFMTSTLIKCAFLEGAISFAIVAYLLTADSLFIGTACILMAIFYTFKPSQAKAIEDLSLNYDEAAAVNAPNAVIAEAPARE